MQTAVMFDPVGLSLVLHWPGRHAGMTEDCMHDNSLLKLSCPPVFGTEFETLDVSGTDCNDCALTGVDGVFLAKAAPLANPRNL